MEMYIMKKRKVYQENKSYRETETQRQGEQSMGFSSNERKKRVSMILAILKSQGEIEKEKAIAQISFNFGLSERKVKEYIKLMIALDVIKEENGYITVK